MMASGGTETEVLSAAAAIKTNTSTEEVWSAPVSAVIYRLRVWEDLRNLFQEDELTDVMLAAEGQSIPCHRVLLAAASKFFHSKFVVHPESLDHNLLDIEDIDFDTLKAIVSYIYCGQVALTVEKTEKLIPASLNLMLPELTQVCKDFLFDKVIHDTTACIDIHRIAKINSLTDLAEKAWQVLLEKFQEVLQLDSFKKMSEIELQEYIRDERLNIANQDPVFQAVVTWIRHDVENRKSSFEKLIENVKLSHCTPRFLKEVVRQEAMMKTIKCLEHLAEALCHYIPADVDTSSGGYTQNNTLIALYQGYCWTLTDGAPNWIRQQPLARTILLKYA